MNLARSTFYRKPKAWNHDGMKAEADLIDRIETICLESPVHSVSEIWALKRISLLISSQVRGNHCGRYCPWAP